MISICFYCKLIKNVEKDLIKGNAIIVDATHSKSKGINESPIQMLRRTSKELRKEIYCKRPELAEKFPEKPTDEDSYEDELAYVNELIKVLEDEISEADHIFTYISFVTEFWFYTQKMRRFFSSLLKIYLKNFTIIPNLMV